MFIVHPILTLLAIVAAGITFGWASMLAWIAIGQLGSKQSDHDIEEMRKHREGK